MSDALLEEIDEEDERNLDKDYLKDKFIKPAMEKAKDYAVRKLPGDGENTNSSI